MRRQVSLLLDHGHSAARSYPIGMVVDEYRLVEERLNALEANRSVLLQMAVASLLEKKAEKAFNDVLTDLRDG